MNGLIIGLVALAALVATSATGADDPPSRQIDPPPGPQDYIAAFPPNRWVFGKLLWQGREACTKDYCEAAYNAQPLSLLVQKEKASPDCCDGDSYSLIVIGRVAGCSSVSYYLAWSKDFYRLGKEERLAFLSRHVAAIASQISASCGKSLRSTVPTNELVQLWR